MQVTVSPSIIKGTITAPSSKSAMQRACAAALLRKGVTVLNNPGISADDKSALSIIQQLGATVKDDKGTVIVESKGVNPVSREIFCGESGLSSRMFTSIAALSDKPLTITGQGSLAARPFSFFTEVLPQLEVECNSNNGFLPLTLKGPMRPKSIVVDGSLSSQFLTGLLFAYSAAGASNVAIAVKELNSKPYIDMTMQILKDFGMNVPVNHNYESFRFGDLAANKPASQLNYTIEGDWSSASFLLVTGAIAGDIVVKGLDNFSVQADKSILQALMQTGAGISIQQEEINVRSATLKPFQFNAVDCPDLFPPLVALAAYCNGTSVIEGVHRLTHKESNRALTLQEEFGKMGVEIVFQDDLMIVKGGKKIKGAVLQSHNDHRIAMACAVAALSADGKTTIEGAEAVNKSYLQFWEHLHYLTAS